MRGVVSGQDGNHSGSQPSVGTYLDEQPVTTIDGTVDIHVYDIARIEVLEGPQGTLYGASSEAGTIRIITNKPDPTKFSAGYDIGGNSIDHGGLGWAAEGFVNIPAVADRGGASRRLGRARCRLHQQRRGHERDCRHRRRRAHLPDLGRRYRQTPTQYQRAEYNTVRNAGRAHRRAG